MRAALLVFFTGCQPAPPPLSGDVPESLKAAHQAWVTEDLDALTAAIHDTLSDAPTPAVAHNAVSLLETAFQHHPRLPADLSLPPGVHRLALDHVHRSGPDGHRYRLVVAALVDGPERLEDLRVSGPGLVSDRRTATWTVTPEDGGHYVELELPDTPAPPAPGLYELTLSGPDGDAHLWTILGADVATEVPRVATPTPGQVFVDTAPQVAVEVEATPEHVDGEPVGYGLWLATVPDHSPVWSDWVEVDTSASEDTHRVDIDADLTPGRYWLAVSRREVRHLGPVSLGRVARRGVPFEVRAP